MKDKRTENRTVTYEATNLRCITDNGAITQRFRESWAKKFGPPDVDIDLQAKKRPYLERSADRQERISRYSQLSTSSTLQIKRKQLIRDIVLCAPAGRNTHSMNVIWVFMTVIFLAY